MKACRFPRSRGCSATRKSARSPTHSSAGPARHRARRALKSLLNTRRQQSVRPELSSAPNLPPSALLDAVVQLLGTRNEMVGGGLRVIEIVATAAVERHSGRVAIQLQPEKTVRSRSALRKIDQSHLIVAVALERNGLGTIAAFRNERETHIGMIEASQRSVSPGQNRT